MAEWPWPTARISRVIDGDTVDALLTRDVGFGITTVLPVRLRLDGINAPPGHTGPGRAARERLAALVEGRDVVAVTTGAYKYGNAGRAADPRAGEWMARLSVDGVDVAAVLLAEGLVAAWDGRGARPGG